MDVKTAMRGAAAAGSRLPAGPAALLLAAGLLALLALDPPPLDGWGRRIEDAVARLLTPPPGEPAACVVTLDGVSPWPPADTALLIDRIADAAPRAIGIAACAEAPPDAALEEAVRRAGNVATGYEFRFGGAGGGDAAPIEGSRIVFITDPWGAHVRRIPRAAGIACAPAASTAAAATGFTNPAAGATDARGGIPLVCAMGDGVYRNLALSLAALAAGSPRLTLRLSGGAVTGIDIGGRLVKTGPGGEMRPRPSRREEAPPVLPASDILSGAAGADRLCGRIVLIGGARPGEASAAEAQAAAAACILRGRAIGSSRLAAAVAAALTALIPAAAWLAGGGMRRRGLVAAGGAAAAVAAAILFLELRDEAVNLLYPLAAALLALALPPWR
ncbi:MAG: CHASE2 domain-containing protein [bacterium]|nr:CHASE2 domain-containing protein [bacterium]